MVETLHITHCFRPRVLSSKQILDFDHKLAEIGCKMIFLKASQAPIWDRCFKNREREEFLQKYGTKYGLDLIDIHEYFVNEQEITEHLVARSKMDTVILDADGPVFEVLGKAYPFWMK